MTEDRARCGQLADGRVFIYIRHTRHGVKLFASRELSPIGVSKRLIDRGDPAAEPARRMIDTMLRLAKANGLGGRDGLIPNADRLRRFVDEAAKTVGVSAAFLPRTAVYSARILVTVGEG